MPASRYLVDRAGTDVVLVGDSLGMVIQGHDTTVPVTVQDIIYHSRAVRRGLSRAFLMADMPFMSYTTPVQALDNAVRLMQEGAAMMVKLEGGASQVRDRRASGRSTTFRSARIWGCVPSRYTRSEDSRCRDGSRPRPSRCWRMR